MKYNFCTLFDSAYLTRGIAMYNSLVEHCSNFQLFIFAFDQKCYDTLSGLNLKYASIISLKEFENEELLDIKSSRTLAEYCWTCSPSTIWYSIKNYNLDHCVYLDSDICFFSSPKPIFDEIGSDSVGITPHNLSRKLRSSLVYGKFCVQFVYFKNDKYGLAALDWWRNSCINWCYAKMEDGKYGDQKYLDYFSEKFDKVCEISHIGAGVAPWNIDNYNVILLNNSIFLSLKGKSRSGVPLIFFHYQRLKFVEKNNKILAEASNVRLSQMVLKNIYVPYIQKLIAIRNALLKVNELSEPIIFYRRLSTIYLHLLKKLFKEFIFAQKIYYSFNKKRNKVPANIGATIIEK